uniref:RteC domain-containing protein n=1 Tax=Pedobacter schmidteae TaxID=2201271 RepID=UPI000EAE27AB|nr:RteC domain-containing protein [Pedobacter schmidteae]
MRKNNNAKQEFRDLRLKLKAISSRGDFSLMGRFNESISLINAFLAVVRERVTMVAFKDQLEEIYFFKFEKPEYYALKIYEVSLFGILNQRPVGTDEMLRDYYLEELTFISRFFKQYSFLYEYYRSGFTQMDELLFLREGMAPDVLLPEFWELDPEFSTPGDYLFSKFIAYEGLREFILGEIRVLEVRAASAGVGVAADKKWFDWTGEVINLVELGYAIYLSRQLGKASLTEIFHWLEVSFGVEIGIPANRFREIKRRKRLSRTHFLDQMRKSLLDYMDKDDGV